MSRNSHIRLLLGQEVMFLLLAAFFMIALVGGIYALKAHEQGIRKEAEQKAEQRAEQEIEQKTKKPPIIQLKESEGFAFVSGKSDIPSSFALKLRDVIIPSILKNAADYNAKVVEIIGHTDEVNYASPGRGGIAGSNLDSMLLPYLNGNATGDLRPYDNVGLGMARAAAVARLIMMDDRCQSLTVIPLSAGQTVLSSGNLSFGNDVRSDAGRRRIEIRLRRNGE